MKPKLLLHTCCGVCCSYVPRFLMPAFEVTVYFENSNIYPFTEFKKRKAAALTMATKYHLPFIEASYDQPSWYKSVRLKTMDKEGADRCNLCIQHRLIKTFEFAKTNNYPWIASTLSVSRRKSSVKINALGRELSELFGIYFLGKDWKKNNGENLSQQEATNSGIYRQSYCGCIYSYLALKDKSWFKQNTMDADQNIF